MKKLLMMIGMIFPTIVFAKQPTDYFVYTSPQSASDYVYTIDSATKKDSSLLDGYTVEYEDYKNGDGCSITITHYKNSLHLFQIFYTNKTICTDENIVTQTMNDIKPEDLDKTGVDTKYNANTGTCNITINDYRIGPSSKAVFPNTPCLAESNRQRNMVETEEAFRFYKQTNQQEFDKWVLGCVKNLDYKFPHDKTCYIIGTSKSKESTPKQKNTSTGCTDYQPSHSQQKAFESLGLDYAKTKNWGAFVDDNGVLRVNKPSCREIVRYSDEFNKYKGK